LSPLGGVTGLSITDTGGTTSTRSGPARRSDSAAPNCGSPRRRLSRTLATYGPSAVSSPGGDVGDVVGPLTDVPGGSQPPLTHTQSDAGRTDMQLPVGVAGIDPPESPIDCVSGVSADDPPTLNV